MTTNNSINIDYLLLMKFYIQMLIILIILILLFCIFMNNLTALSYMMMLIFYSINLFIIKYLMFNMPIYIFMLFITIIGSMMVMFLYFVSLINNEKSDTLKDKHLLLLLIFMVLMMVTNLMINKNMISIFEFHPKKPFVTMEHMIIYLIYTYPTNMLTLTSIFYLFYIMILVMKMCMNKYTHLRKIKK